MLKRIDRVFIAIIALAYGGWKHWPWWSPLVALAVLIPATIIKALVVNDWRTAAGLHTISVADFAVSMALNLAVLLAVFWAARGARILCKKLRRSQKT